MRVLQFGRYDFQTIKGGVQYFADRLAFHFKKDQQFPLILDEIVTGEGSQTSVVNSTKGDKIIVGQWGDGGSVPMSPGILVWAWKLLLKNKYDIVHLNFPDPWALLAIFFVPKRFKIVVTWHTDIIRQKKLLLVYQPFLQFFMKRVDQIIVATPLHLQSCPQLQALKMDEKVVVVPFGVEPEEWLFTEEVEKKSKAFRQRLEGKMVIFAFGRHVYYKGFEYLIQAMKDLPDCYLILGGSGPLTRSLQKQAQDLQISDRVRFVGRIDEKDLAAYYYAADVFAFPSVDKTEAFGYVQVEAMMCGLPVVSTWLNNGVNFVNLDQETGLVVPTRDGKALSDALESLRKNPELRKKFSGNAKKRAHQMFTAAKTAQGVFQVFSQLMKAR